MKLWIDDIRVPPNEYEWVWAQTADEAFKWLTVVSWATITDISFDHDLGENSKSGYDILVWIEQCVHDGHKLVANLHVHSANPVGRANMQAAIQSINRIVRA